MVKFILVRILQAIPTLFVIATLTFFMTRLAPGGPFDSEKNIPDEIKDKLEAHFGLDKPLHEQFILYISNLLQGDLGPSFKYMGWEVSELIAKAFPVSSRLELPAPGCRRGSGETAIEVSGEVPAIQPVWSR